MHQLTLRITGSRGVVALDLGAETVRRSRGDADDTRVELTPEDVRWSFDRVIDRFVDLAAGHTDENRSPGELGARVVEVLDAATGAPTPVGWRLWTARSAPESSGAGHPTPGPDRRFRHEPARGRPADLGAVR